MFACNNFPFRAFVTMIYWTSTEVLLNLVAPLDSAELLLTLSKSMFFELSNFFELLILLVLYLIRSVSAEVSRNCISRIDLGVPFSDLERINIWFMALIPLALHSFPL